MTISPARPASRLAGLRVPREIAITRAVVAVLWAIVYLVVLHGPLIATLSLHTPTPR